MTFLSFNSNTTGVTSGTGIASPSGATEFTWILVLLDHNSYKVCLQKELPL
jgi:hypothetical protein